MCGGRSQRRAGARLPGVSPVRTAVRISHVGQAQSRQLVADAGQRRFEVEPDVVRQRLQRRDVDDRRSRRAALRAAGPARTSASIAARNAVSVLPEPVGAATSVCRPAAIAGQAAACAAVGRRESACRNQPPTAGWKAASGSLPSIRGSRPAGRASRPAVGAPRPAGRAPRPAIRDIAPVSPAATATSPGRAGPSRPAGS